MHCLDENTLIAFFEARLSDEKASEVDEHTAGCEACRRLLAEYAAIAPARDHRTEPLAALPLEPAAQTEAAKPEDRSDLARRVAQAQAAKRIGRVLCGKWRIERLIGMGGMAQVFEATHRNGRRVAVKMMRPTLAVEPSLVERFLREGYVANKLEHPGAVAILDDDVTDEGVPFLVMELLVGRTLGERLRDQGPLALDAALRVADEALDVLAAAHERGIVHRDIKPDNLFETDGGAIKVLDFGIARLRDQLTSGGETQAGTTMGTVGYMAPEQARGQVAAIDARSDVWAMGATVFTLLTGRIVHDAATPNEALLLSMTVPVPALSSMIAHLPPAVCALLDHARAFDLQARFGIARAMQKATREARALIGTSLPADGGVPATLLSGAAAAAQDGLAAGAQPGACPQPVDGPRTQASVSPTLSTLRGVSGPPRTVRILSSPPQLAPADEAASPRRSSERALGRARLGLGVAAVVVFIMVAIATLVYARIPMVRPASLFAAPMLSSAAAEDREAASTVPEERAEPDPTAEPSGTGSFRRPPSKPAPPGSHGAPPPVTSVSPHPAGSYPQSRDPLGPRK